VKFMTYPFCFPSQISHCYMCSCHHMHCILPVLFPNKFSRYRVCKYLYQSVCFVGVYCLKITLHLHPQLNVQMVVKFSTNIIELITEFSFSKVFVIVILVWLVHIVSKM
jgi:hypothetical protein